MPAWEALPWSMLVTGAAMLVTTLKLGRSSDAPSSSRDAQGWLAKSREELNTTQERPDAGKAPAWAKPEWFAGALILFTGWLVFGAFW